MYMSETIVMMEYVRWSIKWLDITDHDRHVMIISYEAKNTAYETEVQQRKSCVSYII